MTAPTYSTAMKEDRMEATRDLVADGTLEVQDVGNNALVTYALTLTGGTVLGAVWTLAFDNNTVAGAAAAGAGTTADHGVIKDSGGTTQISSLSVGTADTAIIIDNTSIAEGQNVTISSAIITHSADPA